MKEILKKNKLAVVIIIVISIIILFSVNSVLKDVEKSNAYRVQLIQQCKKNVENKSLDEGYIKMCKEVIENENIKIDFYTIFSELLVWKIHYFNAIAFLIITIPTLFNICKILKNKHILNSLTRENYNSFIKKYLKTAYKYIWILPFIALFAIFLIGINSTFSPEYSIKFSTIVWSKELISNPVTFIILYILNIIFYSFTFVNIALIIARKQHKYIPCVILSYIFYIGIELFLEIGLNMLVSNIIFKSDFGIIFNIMNLFMFNDVFGVSTLLLFSFIVMLISFIFVYFMYRNKEKLIIDCEKNN